MGKDSSGIFLYNIKGTLYVQFYNLLKNLQ